MARHIAIVEDEATIRANYAEAMAQQGFRVSGYATRPEALAAVREQLPDLVVIDVGLGDEPEGGFDLCRELRARAASLPIAPTVNRWMRTSLFTSGVSFCAPSWSASSSTVTPARDSS